MILDEDFIEELIDYNLSFYISPKDTIDGLIKDGIMVHQELINRYIK